MTMRRVHVSRQTLPRISMRVLMCTLHSPPSHDDAAICVCFYVVTRRYTQDHPRNQLHSFDTSDQTTNAKHHNHNHVRLEMMSQHNLMPTCHRTGSAAACGCTCVTSVMPPNASFPSSCPSMSASLSTHAHTHTHTHTHRKCGLLACSW
jgi:hypothetical protein